MNLRSEIVGINGAQQSQETSSIVRPEGKITGRKLKQLLEHQDYRCALTGRALTPENCTADHVIPVANGGSNDMANIQLVTNEVNRAKNTMSQRQFVAMCIDVARFNNNRWPT